MKAKTLLTSLILLTPALTFAAPPANKPEKPCKGAKCTTPPSSTSAIEVVGGEKFTCYTHNAALKCVGTIGNYNPLPTLKAPTVIAGLETGVTKIAAGPFNVCAIKENDLYCFGDNDYNQLAQGNYTSTFTPPSLVSNPVKIMSGVKDVAMGFYHGCAVSLDDKLYCWGDNTFGFFGDGTWASHFILPPALKATDVKQVVAAEYHTLILKKNGDVLGAGYNNNGNVGVDYLQSSDIITFSKVNLPGPAKEIIDGFHHNLVRLESGETYSFGFGAFGEMASGSTERDNKTPKLASLIPLDAVKVFAQVYRTCWLKNDEVNCVGSNRDNILGLSSNTWQSSQPVKLAGLRGIPKDMIRNISGERGGNFAHSCVVSSVGIECWGSNYYSQLGGESSDIPVTSPKLIQAL